MSRPSPCPADAPSRDGASVGVSLSEALGVMQLLEKRPEDRPQSALAVLEVLERLRAEAPIMLGAAPDLVRAG